MCVDPVRNISTVLLATRVYPDMYANDDSIVVLRQAFNNAVIAALDAAEAAAATAVAAASAKEESLPAAIASGMKGG